MRRLAIQCAACAALSAMCGCASQVCRVYEYYEPTEATIHERDDGIKIGALKSETIKSGQPDWSGNKTFSLFSW